MNPIQTHTFANGLKLLVEPIEGMASIGMSLLLPGGVVCEPADQLGVGSALSEMLFRGAGDLDARAHSEALDQLGVKRSAEVQSYHMRIGGCFLGTRLTEVLPLLLDMVTRPALPESGLAATKELIIQSIDSLEDEPQQKVMLEIKKAHRGELLGRSPLGERDHVQNLTIEQVREYYQNIFVPNGSILAFTGAVDFEQVRDFVGTYLEQWTGTYNWPTPVPHKPEPYTYVSANSAQQHICMAYNTVSESDPDCMTQRVAIAVLSGGMSGRLFTEVREKRGLCYSVYAAYGSVLHTGTVFAYAGTTAERAQDTLVVMTRELKRMKEGVSQDEFDRAIVGLKSRLVMQGESTSARGMAIASDEFLLGSPRSLNDLEQEVDRVTLDKLNAFVAKHSPTSFTTLNIGPDPLEPNMD